MISHLYAFEHDIAGKCSPELDGRVKGIRRQVLPNIAAVTTTVVEQTDIAQWPSTKNKKSLF